MHPTGIQSYNISYYWVFSISSPNVYEGNFTWCEGDLHEIQAIYPIRSCFVYNLTTSPIEAGDFNCPRAGDFYNYPKHPARLWLELGFFQPESGQHIHHGCPLQHRQQIQPGLCLGCDWRPRWLCELDEICSRHTRQYPFHAGCESGVLDQDDKRCHAGSHGNCSHNNKYQPVDRRWWLEPGRVSFSGISQPPRGIHLVRCAQHRFQPGLRLPRE